MPKHWPHESSSTRIIGCVFAQWLGFFMLQHRLQDLLGAASAVWLHMLLTAWYCFSWRIGIVNCRFQWQLWGDCPMHRKSTNHYFTVGSPRVLSAKSCIVPNERPTSPCLALATLDSAEKHSPHAPQLHPPKIWQANDQTLLSLSSCLSSCLVWADILVEWTNQHLLSRKTGHSEIFWSIRNLACVCFYTMVSGKAIL